MKPEGKNTLRIVVAYILLAAVSFFVTPTELIHACIQHDDTCDAISHNELGQHVEKLHQHCDMLQFSVTPLIHAVNHFTFSTAELLCIQPVESVSSYHHSSSAFLFFRGPPAIARCSIQIDF